MSFVVAAAFAAVLVFLVVRAVIQERRRHAVERWAAANGWSYQEEDPDCVDAWRGDPFGQGHTRRATNVLRCELDGRRAVAFDYSYKVTIHTPKGNVTTTHPFSVYAQQLPAALPDTTIKPERVWDKPAKLLGGEDIELESVEFNDRYRVRADDPKVAYDVLNARAMEALLTVDGVDFRIQGDCIAAVETGKLDVRAVPARVAVLSEIIDRVPTFVWTDRGASPHGGEA